jgi:flavin-binding protein dodecin
MMAVLEGRLRGDSPERMDAAAAHAAAAAWDNGEDVEEAVVIEAQY